MTLKPPSQPRARRATPCHRHPTEPVTGLCAPCLRERLSHLSPSPSNLSSMPSTSVAAASAAIASSSCTLPELRRCKTFSGKKCETIGLSCEPRRRSCEVRVRNTLSTLFSLDDEGNDLGGKCEVESKNLGLLRCTCPVLELKEEENGDDDDAVIRASNDVIVESNEQNLDEFEESKTMKEFIDLEFKSSKPSRRDFKDIAGNFWIAASVFSRKLQKWKRKHNSRSRRVGGDGGEASAAGNGGFGEMRLERLRGRRLRDTQSEVGESGLGRRSCDTDPRFSVDLGRSSIDGGRLSTDLFGRRSCDTDSRFSIDLGRASVDDGGRALASESRCSFDPPRASWDGHFTGRSVVRGNAPMVSVIENAMATVYGFDNQALAEEKLNKLNEEEADYGGSGYLNSVYLQRQRRGLDRCNSKKNMLVKLNDESKAASDSKVSPASIEVFHGTKLLITEKELKDLRLSSLRDDSSESLETASKDVASVSSGSNVKGLKKCRQWSKLWSIWGLLHRRKYDKHKDEEKISRQNAECPLTDSSESIASEVNGDVRLDTNWKLVRSYSTNTVSRPVPQKSRNETTSLKGKKREDVLLDRNRSAIYSPNNLDNGLLRFYLAPLKSSRRSKSGKSQLKKSHSVARTVLRL